MNHFHEYGGGLGDIFFQMFSEGSYAALNRMQPSDRSSVVLITHNPHVRELFDYHPKSAQIDVRDLGYWLPEQDAEMRARHALPAAKPQMPRSDDPIEFFPTLSDLEVLGRLENQPYVLLSVSAGLPSRNIPGKYAHDLALLARRHSLQPVFVGRNYERMGRSEFRPGNGFAIDLVDRLTVPGVGRAVQNAAALVCCHSAINILGWLLRKPQLLLYPQSVYQEHIARRTLWAFGVDHAECHHANFDDPRMMQLAEALFHRAALELPRSGGAIPHFKAKVGYMKTIPLPAPSQALAIDESLPRLTSATETKFLCWLAQHTSGNVAELGCNKGLTTRDLALTNPDKFVYAVDYFGDDGSFPSEQRGEKPGPNDFCIHARGLRNVVCIHAKSAELNYDALQSVKLIFVDGDHSYKGVRADSERAVAYLKSHGGGTIVWHDYYDGAPLWVGVKTYLDSSDLNVERVEGTWLALAKVKGDRTPARSSS
jgi:hypothetical protein